MKVLLLAENWPPRHGGIERYLTNLTSNLENIDVITVAPKVGGYEGDSLNGEFRKRFFYPLFKPSWLPLYWNVSRLVRQRKINLVLCGKALFEGRVGLKLKKKFGIPFIVFTYAMEIEKWLKKPKTKKQLINILTNADKVIYINEITRKRIESLGIGKDRLVKIQPGVSEIFFQGDAESAKKRFNLDRDYILTVARHIKRKGIDDLINAFTVNQKESTYNIDLVIVGEGPETNHLKELALKKNISDHVKFLGNISDNDLVNVMAGAKIFALTPFDLDGDIEGFGIVYLEAAAAGLPVIGTNSGGVSEAIRDQKTGLLADPRSIESIKAKLQYLLLHPEEARSMGQAGKHHAQEFIWPNQASLLAKVISDVVRREN